jgi:hypothetical protein
MIYMNITGKACLGISHQYVKGTTPMDTQSVSLFMGFFLLACVGFIFLLWSWTIRSYQQTPPLSPWYRLIPWPHLLLGGWFLFQVLLFTLIPVPLLRRGIIELDLIGCLDMYLILVQDRRAIEPFLKREEAQEQSRAGVQKKREKVEIRFLGLLFFATLVGPSCCAFIWNAFFQGISAFFFAIGLGIMLSYVVLSIAAYFLVAKT